MKILGYILVGYLALQLLGKNSLFAPAPQTTASGERIVPVSTDIPSTGQIFMDESGDLVTINSTGGTTVLPDPHGIGGGFAT